MSQVIMVQRTIQQQAKERYEFWRAQPKSHLSNRAQTQREVLIKFWQSLSRSSTQEGIL